MTSTLTTDVLIVGGADHKTGHGDPEGSYRTLEEYVRKRWDVESIDYRWSAQFYDPPDGLPMIGRALTSGHVWLATGYSGVGMVFGTLGGMLLTDFALGRENPWAEVYKPSRIKPLAAGPHVLKLNVETVATFVKDRVTISKVTLLGVAMIAGGGAVVAVHGAASSVGK